MQVRCLRCLRWEQLGLKKKRPRRLVYVCLKEGQERFSPDVC